MGTSHEHVTTSRIRPRTAVVAGAVAAAVIASTTAWAAIDRIDGAAQVATRAVRVAVPTATPPPPSGGFPTARSAGVPVGWTPARTIDGDLTVSIAGSVIEDVRVNGSVIVAAPGVTIRRVEVVGGRITNHTGPSCAAGMVVESTTIRRSTAPTDDGGEPAIGDGGYTARGVEIDGLPEGFRVGGRASGCGPVLIQDSWANVVAPDVCTDWHGDGLQGYDGPAVTVRNTVLHLVERSGCGGTAPFFYPSGQGNASADVDGLIVSGGGFPFRLTTGGSVRGLHIVEGSWFYAPTEVTCAALSAWDATIVRLDAEGQPVTVRTLPCGGS